MHLRFSLSERTHQLWRVVSIYPVSYTHLDVYKRQLQYWDLERSVFRPLVEIPLDSGEVLATRIKFNAVGDLIVVGFEDGTTSVWKIQQYINTIQSLDIGLQHYL